MLAGIDGRSFSFSGSTCGLMFGLEICLSTIPLNVLCPSPSTRDCLKAASRLGPVVPVVPARASVWHAPHFSAKSTLPFTTSVPLSFSWQLLRTRAPTAQPTTSDGPWPPPTLLMLGILIVAATECVVRH